jgi:hypothetical protein
VPQPFVETLALHKHPIKQTEVHSRFFTMPSESTRGPRPRTARSKRKSTLSPCDWTTSVL